MSYLYSLAAHRELIQFLVAADLKTSHKNTFFGFLWWFLDPILEMLVYYFLVAVILRNPQSDYMPFLFASLVPWRWFTISVNEGMGALAQHISLMKFVKFPKAVYPLAKLLANTFHFAIGMAVLVAFLLLTGRTLSHYVLFLPAVMAVQFLFGFGCVLLFSVWGVFFADLKNILQYLLRMWFYLSPAIYSIEAVPESFRPWYRLNPFSPILDSYHRVLLDASAPDWAGLIYVTAASLVLITFGIRLISTKEKLFIKVG